ncbi:phosphotransferase enzyme family protein [Hoylesella shahii]|uniref:Ser/Thr protein kinase RdoA (MazF antagonist) n=1 Tax=Hoylesella shahii DSM 15611 = JCM 12083 TaxID=1122991 RepID=A0A318HV54_9BACT|nr:aminoglycoside phosphotransferase family protein [Hoylesella shahii]PXX22113.1 Ser/Thr protein kinase RdoA (MazF antagonist) [Hoylesella shahii DSM 15611 = JCM 12083]
MEEKNLLQLVSHFDVQGTVKSVKPLGNGLINDTYKVAMNEEDAPAYVLQRINNAIFKDVELLQSNIEAVTAHLRKKLEEKQVADIDRRVLHFIKAETGKTYWREADDTYWRMMRFIPNAFTYETVNEKYSHAAGLAFGEFEAALVDLPQQLGETIPDFHNMELRARQLKEAVQNNPVKRLSVVESMVEELNRNVEEMCKAEQLHRDGKLPKRICHCDTKVNNMMFDADGNILCVIDLDTVMPSYVFSDYGDFLRTGANFTAEDDPNLANVGFNMDIFKAFTKGYLTSAGAFLTPIEREHLPFAAKLFPFMQCVRFLTDYINGDVYYKIKYPEHNLDRAKNQLALFNSVCSHEEEMKNFIAENSK